MSVLLPRQPAWLQDKGYSARDDRAVVQALGPGVVTGLGASPGSGMNMTVQPGLAIIPGTRNTGQGHYLQRSDAVVTVPWPAAGASPRTDTLYMAIVDNAEIAIAGGAAQPQEGCIFDVATGSNPAPPDSLNLCTVLIPAGATSILAANIAPVFTPSVRPPPVVTALPNGPSDSQVIDYNPAGSVVWHLRLIGSSWFFLGGTSLYGFDQPLATADGTLTVRAPGITIPRPGLYQIEFGFQAIAHVMPAYVQGSIGGPGISGGTEPICQASTVSIDVPTAVAMTGEYQFNASGPAAMYFTGAGTSVSSYRRWIRVTPVWIT